MISCNLSEYIQWHQLKWLLTTFHKKQQHNDPTSQSTVLHQITPQSTNSDRNTAWHTDGKTESWVQNWQLAGSRIGWLSKLTIREYLPCTSLSTWSSLWDFILSFFLWLLHILFFFYIIFLILSSIPISLLHNVDRHWDRASKITTLTNMSLLSTREKSYKGLARTKSVTEKIASTELPCRKASQSNSARVYSVVLSLNDCCTTKGEDK